MIDAQTVTLNVEIYVPNREMPLLWPLRVDINRPIDSIDELMAYAYDDLERIMADNRQVNLMLVDEQSSRHIVPKVNILALSIQAPDKSFIDWKDED